VLDEYTDEFGTDLEGKIPEFNTPAPQGFIPPSPSVPHSARYQTYLQPQPPPPPPAPPVYQYVYPPQQPPVPPPVVQPVYQQPAPAYAPPPPPPVPTARINSVFAGESQELNELIKAEENSGCLKNLLFVLICFAVVVGSFGLSYMIGAKFILPGQRNVAPSFSVTRGLSRVKRLMDGSDIIRDERAFTTYTTPVASRPAVVPPEVRHSSPPVRPPVAQASPPPRPAARPAETVTMYRVVVGAFDTRQEALDVAVNVRADGFPVYQYRADGKYRLQIGAFRSKALATALMKKAGEYGYNAYISIK
jgi:hypothetical protein